MAVAEMMVEFLYAMTKSPLAKTSLELSMMGLKMNWGGMDAASTGNLSDVANSQ